MAQEWRGGRCLVFEAVNRRRKEVLIGVGLEGFETSFRSEPDVLPPTWDPSDPVEFRVVERDLDVASAADFALRYSESQALRPYRVYLGGLTPALRGRAPAMASGSSQGL